MEKFLSLIIVSLISFILISSKSIAIAKDDINNNEDQNYILNYASNVRLSTSIEHNVRYGETIESISHLYGIDKKWIIYSNVGNIIDNLNYDENDSIELKEGQNILIPHKEGIAYKVVKGDDMNKILEDFGISKQKYLEINGTLEIHPNEIVLIPSPKFIEEEIVYGPKATRFGKGQCTFHVSQKVLGINWGGNAKHWIKNAKEKGHLIGDRPVKGAIVQFSGRGMPLGHVGYVEEIFDNGDFKISEMNFKRLGEITYRVIKRNNKTIDGFIYLNESKKEYLSNNLESLLIKSNKNF